MGKRVNYYNAKGQKIEKAAYDKSTCCSVTIDKGTWDLLLVCPATKEMFDALSADLGQWLKLRKENMAEPWKQGSKIDVHDEKVDEFTVILPNCAIKDEHIAKIGGWWNDWCNNLLNPAPASDDKSQDPPKDDPKDNKSGGEPQDPPKDKSDGDGNQPQNQPPKQPDPKPAAPAPKKFYEMTPEELFEYNIKERERMMVMNRSLK